MTDRILVITDKEIPDPFRGFANIEKGKPVSVRKSQYWNRRVRQGDVKLYEEVKKVIKKEKGDDKK